MITITTDGKRLDWIQVSTDSDIGESVLATALAEVRAATGLPKHRVRGSLDATPDGLEVTITTRSHRLRLMDKTAEAVAVALRRDHGPVQMTRHRPWSIGEIASMRGKGADRLRFDTDSLPNSLD